MTGGSWVQLPETDYAVAPVQTPEDVAQFVKDVVTRLDGGQAGASDWYELAGRITAGLLANPNVVPGLPYPVQR